MVYPVLLRAYRPPKWARPLRSCLHTTFISPAPGGRCWIGAQMEISSSGSRGASRHSKRNLGRVLSICWEVATEPRVWSIVFLLLGSALIITPMANLPSGPSADWWFAPLRQTDVSRLLVAAWWSGIAILIANRRSAGRVCPRWGSVQWIGGLVLVVSLALSLSGWATLGRDVPMGAMTVGNAGRDWSEPLGRSDGLRLMFDRTVALKSIEGDQATLLLSSPSQKGPLPIRISPATPIEIGDSTLAMVAVEPDLMNRVALLQGVCPAGRDACRKGEHLGPKVKARVGEEISVGDPPTSFRVHGIESNFQGVMGPAVELSRQDAPERFWVFQRDSLAEEHALNHDVALLSVEAGDRVVLSVSRSVDARITQAIALLFALGFGLFLFPTVRETLRGTSHKQRGA
jgi:hypothetical protein